MTEDLIGRVPLFAGLPPVERAVLATQLTERIFSAGTILFHEGDYGDRFYILLDGEVAIIKALGTLDERRIATRGAGEFVGEMSLFDPDGLRTATVRAETDARMLELSRVEFDALLHRYPMLAYEMLRVMSTRLRASHDAAIRDLHAKNERLQQAYTDLRAAQARLIEQASLERELQRAREIQESILPRRLPQLDGFDIGARMMPARMVGGDLFDIIPLDADTLAVVIGDVSGKGIPAALFMALTCSLLRAESGRNNTPEETLRNVNRHLLGMNAQGMFVTLLYGIVRRGCREFTYVRAGHDPPLVIHADGTVVVPPLGRAMPLGLFPFSPLETTTIELPPGSTVLLYTDGVTEATDTSGLMFGLEQLEVLARETRAWQAQQVCDHLVARVTAYHGSAPQTDDITLVATRTLGSG